MRQSFCHSADYVALSLEMLLHEVRINEGKDLDMQGCNKFIFLKTLTIG